MKEYSSTNRNLVRKLEKEGFEYLITNKKQDLDEFIEMYYSTMSNVGANTFYYFQKELIQKLFKDLEEKIFLAKVHKVGVAYCYSLFFISGGIATYYLSARNPEYGKIPATNYLLSKTVEYLKEKQLKILNFGGGLTNDLNDSLFIFKSNFSRTNKNFYVGKRIFNYEIYNQIINDYILSHGLDNFEQKKHILQFYR